MKKGLFTAILLLLTLNVYSQQKQKEDFGLPVLHIIKETTLSPNYGCRSAEDFKKGYAETALFVSDYSKRRNSPDLLFNGACNSEDYFEASTAGNDVALIADYGENILIENISADKIFNLQRVAVDEAYTKFTTRSKVQKNHTYAVILTKNELRGWFVFTVTDYVKNKKVDLKYAVKMYEIYSSKVRANDFSWEKGNENK